MSSCPLSGIAFYATHEEIRDLAFMRFFFSIFFSYHFVPSRLSLNDLELSQRMIFSKSKYFLLPPLIFRLLSTAALLPDALSCNIKL